MRETMNYDIWPRPWNLRTRLSHFFAYVSERGRRVEIAGIGGISFRVTASKTIHCDGVSEVDGILGRYPEPSFWHMQVQLPKPDERPSAASLGVHIDADATCPIVTVNAVDLDVLASAIRQIEEIFGFALLAEDRPRQQVRHATAFVGCHFDATGIAAAKRLKEFLDLLGFHRVLIADQYDSKTIPEKVMSGIRGCDYYFGIVTGKRSHQWIDSESAFALGERKGVVLLLEAGSDYGPTLTGQDRQYIPFKTSVDESFVSLLRLFRDQKVMGM